MNEERHYHIVVHRIVGDGLTLEGLSAAAGLHPELIERFVEYGLLEPVRYLGSDMLFGAEAVPRLRTIQRLRWDLGVSLPGVALILELTDKIGELQKEVERLRNML